MYALFSILISCQTKYIQNAIINPKQILLQIGARVMARCKRCQVMRLIRKAWWSYGIEMISHNCPIWGEFTALQWRHNEQDGVSNHKSHDCLLNRLFKRRSKKTSKLCVTDLCVGNSPVTGEFPAQKASNAENVAIWWRHHIIGQR